MPRRKTKPSQSPGNIVSGQIRLHILHNVDRKRRKKEALLAYEKLVAARPLSPPGARFLAERYVSPGAVEAAALARADESRLAIFDVMRAVEEDTEVSTDWRGAMQREHTRGEP